VSISAVLSLTVSTHCKNPTCFINVRMEFWGLVISSECALVFIYLLLFYVLQSWIQFSPI